MSKSNRKHASQQSVNSAVKGICNIMRRSDCAGALQYVPELTWILFLRILDVREAHEAEEAAALGLAFTPTMRAPYRWQDWADPHSPRRRGEGEYRDALAKAEAIENAAFDLKAVNPNHVTEVDLRTPADLLAEIEARGFQADAALAHLRSLVNHNGSGELGESHFRA